MYELLMNTIRTFVGSGLWRTTLVVAIPLVVLSLVAWSSPAFRGWFNRVREAGSWQGITAAIIAGVVKVMMVLVIARMIIVAMVMQAEIFEFKHGKITEANRSAVLMKWGYPHEQNELSVGFTAKRTWLTRQLLVPGEKDKNTITTDESWKDENLPVQAVDGVLPKVISVREEQRDVPVPQKGVEEAEVQVELTANERKLGGANYAGYQDAWKLQYTVVNRSEKRVTANLRFPLPAKTGNFNKVAIVVDGKNITDTTSTTEGEICWTMPMEPKQKAVVAISYEGRGLEYLRYIPRRMTQSGHYLVTATIANIPVKEIDWCIGSMPPDQELDKVKGMPYRLTWTLDNALTSYDIGIKLPEPKQPSYYVASLLKQAPMGLILLLVVLMVPRLIIGKPVALTEVTLVSAGYYLLYTFMGRLAEVMPSFTLSFVISAAVMSVLVAVLRLRDRDSRLLGWQDTIAFLALAVLYPLAVVDTDRTALWMQMFYVVLLIYACVLVISYRIGPALKGKNQGDQVN